MKIAILFGSSSNEHEVSIASATSIIKNLDSKKYTITPIYLDKNNNFYKWTKPISKISILEVGEYPQELEKISNPFLYLQEFALVWIMIHGKPGEDGTIASILDFLNIKYVGNKASPSLLTMDKILTKTILDQNGIPTTKYIYFSKYNEEFIYKNQTLTEEEVIKTITSTFNYPFYLKASSSGSSIGVYKVSNLPDLQKALKEVLTIDNRFLIEEECLGRELECAILEDKEQIHASSIGEVLAQDKFYTYDHKYHSASPNTRIPANLNSDILKKIQTMAIQAFKILGCHGYSRCDFFLKDNEIYLNEINTIPGFTPISMYPKLLEFDNISYSKLLDILIANALN